MTEQNYRIRIKHGEVEIEAEGDKEFVEKHIEEFKKEMLKIAKELPPKEVTPEIPRKEIDWGELSLGEFYKQKQPKNHNKTVVVFAYWLTKRKGQEEFQPKDIRACYGEAKISKPKNVRQHISVNVSKGYLTTGSKKSWYKLTRTGKEFVEKELPPKSKE
jgi:hypothetical protein